MCESYIISSFKLQIFILKVFKYAIGDSESNISFLNQKSNLSLF